MTRATYPIVSLLEQMERRKPKGEPTTRFAQKIAIKTEADIYELI